MKEFVNFLKQNGDIFDKAIEMQGSKFFVKKNFVGKKKLVGGFL